MINGLTLSTGATISTTGGTTQTFNQSGTDVPSGIEVVDIGATDYKTRPKAVFKVRMPSQSTDGSFTKMKLSASFVLPMVDSKGVVQYNLVRVEVEKHPEITVAHAAELLNKGSQLCTDSDLSAFWTTGSKA